MSTVNLNAAVLVSATESAPEEAYVAAAAFLARYSGGRSRRTASTCATTSSGAPASDWLYSTQKRAHLELWRAASEERGLADSTIDRRLSTICGYYRFAHIDERISANPAQYVRRPKVHPSEGRGLDRAELGTFLFTAERYDHDHAALAVLLPARWGRPSTPVRGRGSCVLCRGSSEREEARMVPFREELSDHLAKTIPQIRVEWRSAGYMLVLSDAEQAADLLSRSLLDNTSQVLVSPDERAPHQKG